ncbi:PREDICTED: cAMP-responsive element-binding protein-like 2 [Mesitornis unicolor]|uniref:cAMP-responsive element-binding protein-like 2 n=1 Tax=Mesitornis unicolor TaxID=54374 RepID=UPI0005294303|nr:PREDICTED: cAMP-responsive element-binding protein-like 2 [Mesitornis unicolor]
MASPAPQGPPLATASVEPHYTGCHQLRGLQHHHSHSRRLHKYWSYLLKSYNVVGGKVKKPGKRGRKPAKIDLKAKLERSRQSARECRARKKLRYQYLEELVSSRERAICALREELDMYKQWCVAMDQGKIPSEIKALLTGEEQGKAQQNSTKLAKAGKTEANSSNP